MNDGLLESLREIGWADLPNPIGADYKKKWIKAIVKVLRSNGRTGYCLAVNDGSDKPRLTKDFFPTAIISQVISIHPYEEAEVKKIMPTLRNDGDILSYLSKSRHKREDLISLLSMDNKTPEEIKRDRETVNGFIHEEAMKQARVKSEENDRLAKFIEIAEPNLKEKNIKAKKYGRKASQRNSGGTKEQSERKTRGRKKENQV